MKIFSLVRLTCLAVVIRGFWGTFFCFFRILLKCLLSFYLSLSLIYEPTDQINSFWTQIRQHKLHSTKINYVCTWLFVFVYPIFSMLNKGTKKPANVTLGERLKSALYRSRIFKNLLLWAYVITVIFTNGSILFVNTI